jgi:hypothetical protein
MKLTTFLLERYDIAVFGPQVPPQASEASPSASAALRKLPYCAAAGHCSQLPNIVVALGSDADRSRNPTRPPDCYIFEAITF